MGIRSFLKLLRPFLAGRGYAAQPFDSVLVDVQSMLYVAIEYSVKTDEDGFFREVCDHVVRQIERVLREVFETGKHYPFVTVVVCFDGAGVPMKWPTQRQRRTASERPSRKRIYRASLFGDNTLSARVRDALRKTLASGAFWIDGPAQVQFVLSGCDVPGEGEHKIFEVAEHMGLRRPVVVSVDNDVFVLSLFRLDRYLDVQVYRKGHFYDVTWLAETALPYPARRLLAASFLFGNDFVPCVLPITDSNVLAIHDALAADDCPRDTWPGVVATVLGRVKCRFDERRPPGSGRRLAVEFWKTCLWIRDYYTRHRFPQRNMANVVFDAFDRDAVMTVLSDADRSEEAFGEAREEYALAVAAGPAEGHLSVGHALRQVFDDDDVLLRVERLVNRTSGGGDAGDTIDTITLTARRR